MSDLLATITSEAELLAGFVLLLNEEQDALKRGDAAALPALTQRKSELMDAMNSLAQLRNELLARSACGKDKEGMSAWLAQHPSDKSAQQSWAKLLQLAQQGRELNRLNGQLIQLRLQATQEALTSLNQQARQTALYGPDGQASPLTGYRIIDSA